MTQYAFGSGTLVCKRTDVTGTPPCLIGTLQDVSLDFDRKIETLLGQYNMAVAAGGGEFKITGKTKFARLQATTINNLLPRPDADGELHAGDDDGRGRHRRFRRRSPSPTARPSSRITASSTHRPACSSCRSPRRRRRASTA